MIAFVIGSAIPQVQTIIGLIASIAIMQFTYTFPPLLRFGYDVMTDAMVADQPFLPGKGVSGRVDGWHQWSRWKRVSLSVLDGIDHEDRGGCGRRTLTELYD